MMFRTSPTVAPPATKPNIQEQMMFVIFKASLKRTESAALGATRRNRDNHNPRCQLSQILRQILFRRARAFSTPAAAHITPPSASMIFACSEIPARTFRRTRS